MPAGKGGYESRDIISGDGENDFQCKYSVLQPQTALAVIFFGGCSDVRQSEAVYKGIFFRSAAGCRCMGRSIIFYSDCQKIPYTAGSYGDKPPVFRKLFGGFYGIVKSVAENSADIQRLNKKAVFKGDRGAEINLPCLCRPGFVPDDNIQEFISGMVETLIFQDLVLQFLDGIFYNLAVIGLALEDQQMIFQVMVNTAYPILITHPIHIIGLFYFQLLSMVCCLHRGADVGCKIDAAEAGKNGGSADGIGDERVLGHKVNDRKDSHKGSKHQSIYNKPHFIGQAGGDPAKIFPKELPCQDPE